MTNALKSTGGCLICLFGLTACVVMNEPLGDNFGAAVENNRQAHIINKTPPSSEQPMQTGAKAAAAIERYESGEAAKSADMGSSGLSIDISPQGN